MTSTNLNTSIIRPGLLVSLKTTVSGGVSYQKIDLEPEHAVDERTTEARWETTRQIKDRAEYERAQKARSKARTLICAACCPTSFGLLCPVGRENVLSEAIAEARAVADEHNRTASFTRVEVYAITGRVSDSDEEAARAIASEVRGLIGDMERGIKAADPKVIRDAANKARMLAGMLSEDVQGKVGAAIKQAREAAREIVQRIDKAGEQAASVVDSLVLDKLDAARFAVLDLSAEGAPVPVIEAVAAPAAPAIDLMATEATQSAVDAVIVHDIEL